VDSVRCIEMGPIGIPWEAHGNGITKLISWEWEWEYEWLRTGMGGNENSTFSHFQPKEENQPVSGATSASLGTSADSDTLDCHYSRPAKKRRVFNFKDLCDPEDDQTRSELEEYVNMYGNGSGRKWE